MLVIFLIILTIILYFHLDRELNARFSKELCLHEKIKREFEEVSSKNELVKKENIFLDNKAYEIIALYDITKAINKTLDEDKMFVFFKDNIKKFINIDDCVFIKEEADVAKYKKYTLFPLVLQRKTYAYLAVNNLSKEDMEKFDILAHQFLLGYKRIQLYKKIQEMTIIDSLTKVFNRRYFLERFFEEFKRSKKLRLNLSFLMVDIDNFKSYNDHFGHLVGDAILREVSRIIKENIRQVDFVGRYGGEEIAIGLTETSIEQARLASERIRKEIESRKIKIYDEEIMITVSIGIAAFPNSAANPERLIENADKALYMAKHSGKNRVCLYPNNN
ncbi:MAG: GGDEF domain-containing protein [Candidatus Omnitrophica bacterium]|nr:GGDEF domain-containing protein [Candidatus Omnitrophota bacterium]